MFDFIYLFGVKCAYFTSESFCFTMTKCSPPPCICFTITTLSSLKLNCFMSNTLPNVECSGNCSSYIELSEL